MKRLFKIGTRRSLLALWQAHFVRDQLKAHYPDVEVELVEIVSEGDKRLDVPLSEIGGKGLFLKELEHALLNKSVDMAVHSMKDVTATMPEGLHIPVICVREDPRDAFVSNHFKTLESMPAGSRLGTCSLRRQCLIGQSYPELELVNIRGNVNSRLAKLDNGEYDGLLLASAGLIRLNLADRIAEYISPERCLPAVGQGAVGIETRICDDEVNDLLQPLSHSETTLRVLAERATNERLEGGCHLPIAVYAELKENQLHLRAMLGQPDGSQVLRSELTGPQDDPVGLGVAVANDLLDQGAKHILDSVRRD